MAPEPYAEVIGTPYAAWLGPIGAPVPAIDLPTASFDPSWVLLGTNGINNQGTGGVTINLGRTMQSFTPAGGTLPVKGWVTDEAITIDLSVVDTTVEQLAMIKDDAAVTSVTATTGRAAQKSISLITGVQVHYYALLIRGLSPYDDGTNTMNAQYEFGRVFQSATQAPKYLKGTPAELACSFTATGDTLTGFGSAVYRAMSAAHS